LSFTRSRLTLLGLLWLLLAAVPACARLEVARVRYSLSPCLSARSHQGQGRIWPRAAAVLACARLEVARGWLLVAYVLACVECEVVVAVPCARLDLARPFRLPELCVSNEFIFL
jgi:hypothetical protein